jgi:serine/threonine protein kinase
MHRDLKPDILLLNSQNLIEADARLKISDFKLSLQLKPDEYATNAAGTPFYVAPEIISEKSYDKRCDFWSLGVILFLLLSGSLPFYHKETSVLFDKIKAREYSFTSNVWNYVSSEAKDLVGRLLRVDPDHRITGEKLKNHPWNSGKFLASN